jgi:hypothetical protein
VKIAIQRTLLNELSVDFDIMQASVEMSLDAARKSACATN